MSSALENAPGGKNILEEFKAKGALSRFAQRKQFRIEDLVKACLERTGELTRIKNTPNKGLGAILTSCHAVCVMDTLAVACRMMMEEEQRNARQQGLPTQLVERCFLLVADVYEFMEHIAKIRPLKDQHTVFKYIEAVCNQAFKEESTFMHCHPSHILLLQDKPRPVAGSRGSNSGSFKSDRRSYGSGRGGFYGGRGRWRGGRGGYRDYRYNNNRNNRGAYGNQGGYSHFQNVGMQAMSNEICPIFESPSGQCPGSHVCSMMHMCRGCGAKNHSFRYCNVPPHGQPAQPAQ